MAEKARKKILFVDDSVDFLEIFTAAMEAQSQGEWEVHTATDAAKALAVLQETTMHLAVVDAQMPLVDGLQLLKLIGMKYPHLPKVVLTGCPNPHDRAASMANGADLYLEKPTSPEGIETIYSTLNELARVESEEQGFQGTLRRVGLNDILQMECLGRNSAILEIFNKETRGDIFIKNGNIIHAQSSNNLTGQPAFFFLLSISGGGFKIKPFVSPAEISITQSWEHLLMEAARRRDETDIIRRTAASSAEEIDQQLEISEQTTRTNKPGASNASLKMPKVKISRQKREAVQINEMAVFSGQGDVLYEWQCADIELRRRFLQFISEQSKKIGEGLELGRFDLVELHSPRVRLVAQVQDDAGVYVGANKLQAAGSDTAVA